MRSSTTSPFFHVRLIRAYPRLLSLVETGSPLTFRLSPRHQAGIRTFRWNAVGAAGSTEILTVPSHGYFVVCPTEIGVCFNTAEARLPTNRFTYKLSGSVP